MRPRRRFQCACCCCIYVNTPLLLLFSADREREWARRGGKVNERRSQNGDISETRNKKTKKKKGAAVPPLPRAPIIKLSVCMPTTLRRRKETMIIDGAL